MHGAPALSFLAELKRRNVVRMAGLYLVASWLLVQVAGTVLPMFEVPYPFPATRERLTTPPNIFIAELKLRSTHS